MTISLSKTKRGIRLAGLLAGLVVLTGCWLEPVTPRHCQSVWA